MYTKYTHYIDTDEPVMLINKHIGRDEDEGEGICGDQFQAELMYLDGLNKKRIKVLICSPGGSVFDGMQIYNAILSTKTKVDTYNVGVAASIAGVIFQAGRVRYMSDYALLMVHNPFTTEDSKASPELIHFKASIVKMLARKTDTSEEQISDLMNNTSWLNAEVCKKMGFCDEIENSSELNKQRSIAPPKAAETVKDTYNVFKNYFNSISIVETKTNKNQMKKVYNKLNLIESSSEDAIITAIEAIENRAKGAESEKDSLTEALATAKTELETVKNKLVTFEAEAKAAKEAKDAEAATALENAATLLVENAAKIGKIKNDEASISKWKGQAIKDFDGTKEMIESLPLNKSGVKAEDLNKGGDDAPVPYRMGAAMVEIHNRTKIG